MLKFGKKTQYALVALFHLDRVSPPGGRVSTRDLSALYGIPEEHLGKVLQKLSKAGLLTAVKGVQGGYELAAPPSGLHLGDVIDALEPSGRGARTRRPPGYGPFPPCRVQGMAREVERRAIQHLHDMRLADLLEELEPCKAAATRLEMTS